MEEKEQIEKNRADKKRRKEKKEKHWDMMKWVVAFIDENKEAWDQRRREETLERERRKEAEEWRLMSKEQRITKLRYADTGTQNLKKCVLKVTTK